MSKLVHRSYPRTVFEAPIQYAVLNSHQFHATRLHNYSAGGLCYEADQPLAPEAEVCIVMENYAAGQSGPEAYRSYLAKTRWIQPVSRNGTVRYAIGAQIVARSHEILAAETRESRQICDLCGVLVPVERMHQTEGNAQLCGQCHKHFQGIPPGKLRQCLERFWVGNVV